MGEIAATVERAAHLVSVHLDIVNGELGLTQGEAHVLAQVARRGPTAIGVLHHEFGHKRSTLTNIIDRLEARRLVRRALNPDDRRSFIVHLTPAGRRSARRVTQALDKLEQEVRTVVHERDLAGLAAVARALDTLAHRRAAGRRTPPGPR